jgi:hypothetical protein
MWPFSQSAPTPKPRVFKHTCTPDEAQELLPLMDAETIIKKMLEHPETTRRHFTLLPRLAAPPKGPRMLRFQMWQKVKEILHKAHPELDTVERGEYEIDETSHRPVLSFTEAK